MVSLWYIIVFFPLRSNASWSSSIQNRNRVFFSLYETRIFSSFSLSELIDRSIFTPMDYDFRNRAGPPYDTHIPMYRPAPTTNSSSSTTHASSLYPRVSPSGHPPPARSSSLHQNSSSAGLGIRVTIKPEYRITAPPQMSPHVGDIPRSTFQFDFDFEKKILAEAEKESQNWGRLGQENLPSRTSESTSSMGSMDPVVSKYISSGLNREAVLIAVANYGDNPTKVREFATGFNLLREMGFPSNSVAEALAMYDNDTDRALAHFLNSSS